MRRCKQGYDKRGNLGKQRVLVIVSCTFLELAACPRLALVVWGLHVPTDFRNHAQFRPLAKQVSKAETRNRFLKACARCYSCYANLHA